MKHTIAGLAVAFLLSLPLRAQEVLFEVEGPIATTYAPIGFLVGGVGDLDADGRADFAYRTPRGIEVRSGATGKRLFEPVSETFTGFSGGGVDERIRPAGDFDGDGHADFVLGTVAHSGRDGSLLFVASLQRDGAYLPAQQLVPLGDVDGDGCADALIGNSGSRVLRCGGHQITIGSFGAHYVGWAAVLSGKDRRPIRVHEAASTFGWYAGLLAAVGDLDGDGLEDYLIGDTEQAYGANFPGGGPCGTFGDGWVEAFSSASGELLWHLDSHAADVVAVDDLDGDGLGDLALALPYQRTIQVHAGATGALLGAIDDLPTPGYFGARVSVTADVDGDGYRDLLVGDHQGLRSYSGGALYPGCVSVVSLRTGEFLRRFPGPAIGSLYGSGVAHLGDVNGDDRPDFLVGAPGWWVPDPRIPYLRHTVGRVQVVSSGALAGEGRAASGRRGGAPSLATVPLSR